MLIVFFLDNIVINLRARLEFCSELCLMNKEKCPTPVAYTQKAQIKSVDEMQKIIEG